MTKVGLSGARSRLQQRFPKMITILIGLVGILAFYPLTGCAGPGGASALSGASTSTSTSTAMPTATLQQSPWKLIWSDEFDGSAGTLPDPSKWTPNVGGEGWGNQQLDYDTNNQNAHQDGHGNLVIEARKGNAAGYHCWYGPCRYTSGQISTKGHFSFTYGRIEARIKIPYGQGIWSAFWLLGDNCDKVGWPTCGEVDIMENVSNQPDTVYGTVHGPGYSSGTYRLQHGKFADDFHIFALQWDPNHLYFMVDGITYHTISRTTFAKPGDWVYDHPFHIILNLPVGGVWPGNPNFTTAFPQRMDVSYVRVYTRA